MSLPSEGSKREGLRLSTKRHWKAAQGATRSGAWRLLAQRPGTSRMASSRLCVENTGPGVAGYTHLAFGRSLRSCGPDAGQSQPTGLTDQSYSPLSGMFPKCGQTAFSFFAGLGNPSKNEAHFGDAPKSGWPCCFCAPGQPHYVPLHLQRLGREGELGGRGWGDELMRDPFV